MNISSAIVYTKDAKNVVRGIGEIAGCEVHLCDADKGIIIVSIEAESVEKEMEILECINRLDGVVEANMHYSYSEEELERARANISSEVSPILDEQTPLEQVRYSGSVYNQMNKDQ